MTQLTKDKSLIIFTTISLFWEYVDHKPMAGIIINAFFSINICFYVDWCQTAWAGSKELKAKEEIPPVWLYYVKCDYTSAVNIQWAAVAYMVQTQARLSFEIVVSVLTAK